MEYDDDLFTPDEKRPDDSAPRAERSSGNQQTGCGMKLFLIILAVVGGLTMLCCCGIGITVYSVTPEIEENPALVKQDLARMLKIDLPEGFEPKRSFTMKLFSFIAMDGVFVENSESGVIILMEFSGALAENKELQESFKQGLGESSSSDELKVEEQTIKEVTIGGETIEFKFIKGTDRNTNQEVRQVHGVLPGKNGPILFILSLAEEKWDEEQVMKMLESIEIPKD